MYLRIVCVLLNLCILVSFEDTGTFAITGQSTSTRHHVTTSKSTSPTKHNTHQATKATTTHNTHQATKATTTHNTHKATKATTTHNTHQATKATKATTTHNTHQATKETSTHDTHQATKATTTHNTHQATKATTKHNTHQATKVTTTHDAHQATKATTTHNTHQATKATTTHNTHQATKVTTTHNTHQATKATTTHDAHQATKATTTHNTHQATKATTTHNTHQATKVTTTHNTHQATKATTTHDAHHATKETSTHNTHQATKATTTHDAHQPTKETSTHDTHQATNATTTHNTHQTTKATTTHNTHQATKATTTHDAHQPTKETSTHDTHQATKATTTHNTHQTTKATTTHNTHQATKATTTHNTYPATKVSTTHNTHQATKDSTTHNTHQATKDSTTHNTHQATKDSTTHNTHQATKDSTTHKTHQATKATSTHNTHQATKDSTTHKTHQATKATTTHNTHQATQASSTHNTHQATKASTTHHTTKSATTDNPHQIIKQTTAHRTYQTNDRLDTHQPENDFSSDYQLQTESFPTSVFSSLPYSNNIPVLSENENDFSSSVLDSSPFLSLYTMDQTSMFVELDETDFNTFSLASEIDSIISPSFQSQSSFTSYDQQDETTPLPIPDDQWSSTKSLRSGDYSSFSLTHSSVPSEMFTSSLQSFGKVTSLDAESALSSVSPVNFLDTTESSDVSLSVQSDVQSFVVDDESLTTPKILSSLSSVLLFSLPLSSYDQTSFSLSLSTVSPSALIDKDSPSAYLTLSISTQHLQTRLTPAESFESIGLSASNIISQSLPLTHSDYTSLSEFFTFSTTIVSSRYVEPKPTTVIESETFSRSLEPSTSISLELTQLISLSTPMPSKYTNTLQSTSLKQYNATLNTSGSDAIPTSGDVIGSPTISFSGTASYHASSSVILTLHSSIVILSSEVSFLLDSQDIEEKSSEVVSTLLSTMSLSSAESQSTELEGTVSNEFFNPSFTLTAVSTMDESTYIVPQITHDELLSSSINEHSASSSTSSSKALSTSVLSSEYITTESSDTGYIALELPSSGFSSTYYKSADTTSAMSDTEVFFTSNTRVSEDWSSSVLLTQENLKSMSNFVDSLQTTLSISPSLSSRIYPSTFVESSLTTESVSLLDSSDFTVTSVSSVELKPSVASSYSLHLSSYASNADSIMLTNTISDSVTIPALTSVSFTVSTVSVPAVSTLLPSTEKTTELLSPTGSFSPSIMPVFSSTTPSVTAAPQISISSTSESKRTVPVVSSLTTPLVEMASAMSPSVFDSVVTVSSETVTSSTLKSLVVTSGAVPSITPTSVESSSLPDETVTSSTIVVTSGETSAAPTSVKSSIVPDETLTSSTSESVVVTSGADISITPTSIESSNVPEQTVISSTSQSVVVTSSTLLSSITPSRVESSSVPDLTSDSVLPFSSEVVSSPTPPHTTTPIITVPGPEYWVVTAIEVRKSINVTSESYVTTMEERLAEAYNMAYDRLEQMQKGTFESKKTRRRRYVKNGDIAVQMVNVTRKVGTKDVSLIHTVEKNGTIIVAKEASSTLNLISDQELAIQLQHVVTSSAAPYIEEAGEGPAEDPRLWIIGAVLGPIAGLILLIWIALYIYLKCMRPPPAKEGQEEGEPKLVSLQKPPGDQPDELFKDHSAEFSQIGPRKQPAKKQAYDISEGIPPDDVDPLYAQIQPRTAPVTASDPRRSNVPDLIVESEASPVYSKTHKAKKYRKLPEPVDDANAVQDEWKQRSEALPDIQIPDTFPMIVQNPPSEEDEELHRRADKERKKNKKRLRDRSKKKDEQYKDYLAAQEEIDDVLEAPDQDGLPPVFTKIKKGSPKKKPTDSGYVNGSFDDNEPLAEKRKQMHELLDDAFALISPPISLQDSASSIPNGNALSGIPNGLGPHHEESGKPKKDKEKKKEEKRHTPMYLNDSNNYGGPFDGLETWSPYRAADTVALISMPKTAQTSLSKEPTKFGTKPSKRPIAPLPEPVSHKKLVNGTSKPVIAHSKELGKPNGIAHHGKAKPFTHPPPRFSKQWNVNSLGESQEDDEFPVSQKLNGFDPTLSNTRLTEPSSTASDMEMTTMNGETVPKHKGPAERLPNGIDETDIIRNSVKPGLSPDPLIQSLRDELKQITSKMDRYQRRGSKTLTDIG